MPGKRKDVEASGLPAATGAQEVAKKSKKRKAENGVEEAGGGAPDAGVPFDQKAAEKAAKKNAKRLKREQKEAATGAEAAAAEEEKGAGKKGESTGAEAAAFLKGESECELPECRLPSTLELP